MDCSQNHHSTKISGHTVIMFFTVHWGALHYVPLVQQPALYGWWIQGSCAYLSPSFAISVQFCRYSNTAIGVDCARVEALVPRVHVITTAVSPIVSLHMRCMWRCVWWTAPGRSFHRQCGSVRRITCSQRKWNMLLYSWHINEHASVYGCKYIIHGKSQSF